MAPHNRYFGMTVSDSYQLLPKPGWYLHPKLHPSYLIVEDDLLRLGVWFPLPSRCTPTYYSSTVHRGDPRTILTFQRRSGLGVFWIETTDGRPVTFGLQHFRSTRVLTQLSRRNWQVRHRNDVGVPGWSSTTDSSR